MRRGHKLALSDDCAQGNQKVEQAIGNFGSRFVPGSRHLARVVVAEYCLHEDHVFARERKKLAVGYAS